MGSTEKRPQKLGGESFGGIEDLGFERWDCKGFREFYFFIFFYGVVA